MFSTAIRPLLRQRGRLRVRLAAPCMVVSSRRVNEEYFCTPCSDLLLKNEKCRIFQRQYSSPSQRTISDDSKLNFFVSCLPGLEPVLSAELSSLSIPHSRTVGGANLRGASLGQLLSCHLYLGTASHVLLRCGRPFDARSFAELRRKVAKMTWNRWLLQDAQIMDIRVTASKSKLYHTGAIAERIQKGIDEALGREPQDVNSKTTDPEKSVRLTVRIVKDVVQISIDTSETPVHQRGYRLETAKAPLREDLAFAMLYCSEWKPRYKGNDNQALNYGGLLDPFCGSGTILIEAASTMAGLPPGRLRPVPVGGTHLFDPLLWKSLTADPRTIPFESMSDVIIFGSDRDAGSVRAAASNAARAGVGDLINFQEAALACNPWLDDPSVAPDAPLVVSNLPFGKRIKGKRSENPLLPLYQTFGNRIAGLGRDANVTVLAHDINLARRMGFPINVLFSTHHGGIEVSAMSTLPKQPKEETKSS